MIVPDRAEFRRLARDYNLIPVYREILADTETPVSAYMKTCGGEYSFLLESVEGGERVARYSFLGSNPSLVFMSRRGRVTLLDTFAGKSRSFSSDDPLQDLERLLASYRPAPMESLRRFHGGAVGFLGYDMVRHFERLPDETVDDAQLPDSMFMLTDTALVFDRVAHQVKAVSNAYVKNAAEVDQAYDEAVQKVDALAASLSRPFSHNLKPARGAGDAPSASSNMTPEAFESGVMRIKEYIAAGDAIQVVFAQRFQIELTTPPFSVYRALRTVNPSPYMYFLKFGDLQIAGASPEALATVEDGIVQVQPIAGTRPRGSTPEEDAELEADLRSDPKEKAEHIMLVDLGRNDIGRVCEYGSVHVNEMMAVERYSHVMHLVSNVQGNLRPGMTAFDAVRAAFPAGTLSGAPKIRAMEIIDEMEPTRRGVYGGAVGYFSFSGNSDMAIAIRTLVANGRAGSVQAGGGIVADSVPRLEFQESRNKAMAVLRAVELAHRGWE
ncbi:MAG: anthranilate synthase component I [Candidatus Poribacteria bacterium]|nr:anthranilate synthase component I [Candidatus Poribacteria bacterium]